MDTSDWIMIVSAIIVAIGWFITGHLTQKNEIAKERRGYRLEMLNSFWPILFFLQKNRGTYNPEQEEELTTLLEKARSKFLLYGYNDEIEAYEQVVESLCSQNNEIKIQNLNTLAKIARTRIRNELDLPSIVLQDSLS